MQENENKDFNEAAEELKNIEVNDAQELEILEDTGEEMTEEELYAKYDEMLAQARDGGFINRPYVKIENEEGELANPIGKNNPYLNPFPNRRQRRAMKRMERPKVHNGKSFPILLKRIGDDFLKYHVVRQHIPANITPVFEELTEEQIAEGFKAQVIGGKFHEARTLVHYKLATKFKDNE